MSWTTEKTWAVGDVFTSSDANQYIRDNLQWAKDTVREDVVTKDTVTWNNAASTAYADYGGANFVQVASWVKRQADTDVRVRYAAEGWITSAGTQIRIGAKIGSTDYDGGYMFYNLANTRQGYSGHVIATGIAAGTYTVTLRMKTMTVGTYNVDALDGVSMDVYEGSPV
jgi:hypothetical protein